MQHLLLREAGLHRLPAFLPVRLPCLYLHLQILQLPLYQDLNVVSVVLPFLSKNISAALFSKNKSNIIWFCLIDSLDIFLFMFF